MAKRRLLFLVLVLTAACGGGAGKLTELQRAKSGVLDIVLLSDHEALRHGKDTFVIEFRSELGALVDVGAVKAAANMPMPGMPMFGTIEVRRGALAGRYEATGEFSMAGTWRMAIDWDGPAGKGNVSFSGTVQ